MYLHLKFEMIDAVMCRLSSCLLILSASRVNFPEWLIRGTPKHAREWESQLFALAFFSERYFLYSCQQSLQRYLQI